jgi:hypothetical protein
MKPGGPLQQPYSHIDCSKIPALVVQEVPLPDHDKEGIKDTLGN